MLLRLCTCTIKGRRKANLTKQCSFSKQSVLTGMALILGLISTHRSIHALPTSMYLSDLPMLSAKNGWGPVERDESNGEQAAGDGRTITLNGRTYAKGLGVHALSEVVYQIPAGCTTFASDIGIDDEADPKATVNFRVYLDDAAVLTSPLMISSSTTQSVRLSVDGGRRLKLIVTNAGDTNADDHGDWAGARFECESAGTEPPDVSLSASASTVAPGKPLKVSFTAPEGSSAKDWIALYRMGALNTQYGWSTYTGGQTSGTYSLVAPATLGTYEFRYLTDDSYTDVARSGAIAVVTGSGTPDTQAPSVSLTSPGLDAVISGPVTITANASDNVGVVGVQFQLDGNNLSSEDVSSPYSYQWTPESAHAGAHTLSAVARDAAGNRTQSALIAVNVQASPPSTPSAFLGAQGGGAKGVGGRGGRVIEVANLNDSGPGSLRAAIEASGPRIVVFRVAGIIQPASSMRIRNPYITIAGQTAPGGGILISGKNSPQSPLMIDTHDVTIQYLRVRTGRGMQAAQEGDGIGINSNVYNAVIDHCSVSWGMDENLQVWSDYGPSRSITFSWNLIAEGLANHSCGLITGTNKTADARSMVDIDVHHNLFMHNQNRNPLIMSQSSRVVNNIVYNWEWWAAGFSSGVQIDLIGNIFKRGPDSDSRRHEITWWQDYTEGPGGNPSIYVRGNKGPYQPNPDADNWPMIMIGRSYSSTETPLSRSLQRSSPLPAQAFPITAGSASQLEGVMLPEVGASRRLDQNGNWVSNRDSVDKRLVQEYGNGSGFIPSNEGQVGGLPSIAGGTPYVDSDHDGMPDAWETRYSLNPNSASDGSADADGDGYTNIEEFLNGGDPRVRGQLAPVQGRDDGQADGGNELASRRFKVMPIGDSITEGYNVVGGYRRYLKEDLNAAGSDMDFVGSLFGGPGEGDWEHEGHRGSHIQDIADNVALWLRAYRPDVVLLMIGTNDIVDRIPYGAAGRLSSLIDTISTEQPTATVLVASIPPLADPPFNLDVMAYNASIPSVVAGKQASGQSVRFVDINRALTIADLDGTIHPTADGYSKIASAWFNELRSVVPGPF